MEKIENIKEKNKLINDLRIHNGETEAIFLFREKNADLLGINEKKIINISQFRDLVIVIRFLGE